MTLLKRGANLLVKLNRYMQKLQCYQAIMKTFSTLLPFIFLGALLKYIYQAVLVPEGFFATIYQVEQWLPAYRQIGIIFNGLELVTVSLTALLATLFSAQFLAESLGDDASLVGICGLLVIILLNFNYRLMMNPSGDNHNLLYLKNFDFRYLFLGLLTGILVAYAYHLLTKLRNWIWPAYHHDRSYLERGIRGLFPLIFILILAAVLGYLLNISSQKNLANLFNRLLNLPISNFKHTMLFICFLSIVNGILSFLGFANLISISALGINSNVSVANINYALAHKSVDHVPNPITLHTMYECYGNFGGVGLTLGLILAIILCSRQRRLRQVALLSLIPGGLGTINAPLMVGVPILFNPIMLIPFLLSPLASMSIAWFFINFKMMPPAVYGAPDSTPSFLLGFIGTNGNWVALIVSFLGIAVSTAIYYPFLKILEQEMIKKRVYS